MRRSPRARRRPRPPGPPLAPTIASTGAAIERSAAWRTRGSSICTRSRGPRAGPASLRDEAVARLAHKADGLLEERHVGRRARVPLGAEREQVDQVANLLLSVRVVRTAGRGHDVVLLGED